jgi:hypothetical protein
MGEDGGVGAGRKPKQVGALAPETQPSPFVAMAGRPEGEREKSSELRWGVNIQRPTTNFQWRMGEGLRV